VVEITGPTGQGGLKVFGQEIGFRGDPDLVEVLLIPPERFRSIDGAARQGTKKSEAPVGEDVRGPVTEDFRPAIDIRITKKSSTTPGPFPFHFRHEFGGVEQRCTFYWPGMIVDHRQHQSVMQIEQMSSGSRWDAGEHDSTVPNLAQSMPARLTGTTPGAVQPGIQDSVGDLVLEAVEGMTGEEITFEGGIDF
jgi:hypothetical protein